jgi:hypothetical protein
MLAILTLTFYDLSHRGVTKTGGTDVAYAEGADGTAAVGEVVGDHFLSRTSNCK